MTSEQIKTLATGAAEAASKHAEAGQVESANGALLRATLLEIAYQLAAALEFEKHFRCIRCYRRIEHVEQKCDRAMNNAACLGIGR